MPAIPSIAQINELHHRYAQNDKVFDLVFTHCRIVADIALWCARNVYEPVDRELLEAGCLLHDIGTYIVFDKNGNGGKNAHNYKQHAIFGAALVLEEGYDPRLADMIRTHVLLGLSKNEIIENGWPLPHKDYLPSTIEARLLCYADRFHSKYPAFNDFQSFLTRISSELPEQGKKFEAWSKEFGLPDIPAMARAYGQPVR